MQDIQKLKDEFLSEIEKLSTEKVEKVLTYFLEAMKNNKESKPEKTEVVVNKYLINTKEAIDRLLQQKDFAHSTNLHTVVELGHDFMAIVTGKSKSEVDDWFPGDFLRSNPSLVIYFESFIYLRAYQAGHVDSRERAKRAKKAHSKKNDAVVLKRAV